MPEDPGIRKAADRLLTASRTRTPCAPVRDVLSDGGAETAYAVQNILTADALAAGRRIVGRKVGLTSPAVQRQLGVDQPDFGVLYADMNVSGLATIPSGRLLQPRIEAEIAFVLRHDLAEGNLDEKQIRDAVDYAVAALEIVDSRVAGWDITITDTIADNASSGLFVLAGHQLRLDEFEPARVTMRLYADGELVSQGNGAA